MKVDDLTTITALYVEDESTIRDVIITILGSVFKKIIVGVNGEDGLNRYFEHKDEIDLIITDINMPSMNGLDMLDKIKEDDPFIPMVITTAHNDIDFLHRAIEVGVTGYVTKPIDIRKLLETIKKNALPIVEKKRLETELKKEQEEKLKNAKFTAIGQLSAGITHEINTPLTFIKATIEMMEYDIEDIKNNEDIKKELTQNIEKLKDGVIRIQNIINSMKEVTSVSKDKKEKINIYSTVIVALTLAYNKFKHISDVFINGEKFDINNINKNKEYYCVVAQKQRIEQVWVVIINNAMDELIKKDNFDDRKFDIHISEIDGKVIVKFKDNAGGIKEEILPNIFEPFKSTKESSGLGIGLNIAQKIVIENNAEIKAYNEDNGAVFEIIFEKCD